MGIGNGRESQRTKDRGAEVVRGRGEGTGKFGCQKAIRPCNVSSHKGVVNSLQEPILIGGITENSG